MYWSNDIKSNNHKANNISQNYIVFMKKKSQWLYKKKVYIFSDNSNIKSNNTLSNYWCHTLYIYIYIYIWD